MTYDVVFHPDVNRFLQNVDFKKFVADTAIDGVNRIMAEHKEKLSSDYKMMKHINCKVSKLSTMCFIVCEEVVYQQHFTIGIFSVKKYEDNIT